MTTLSNLQHKQLFDHGFVHVPGVVPRIMVDRALFAINHNLGEGMDPAKVQTYRSQSFCPEIRNEPVITDLLYKTPAIELATDLIGEIEPIHGGQIALRFPTPGGIPRVYEPHLDGMYTPTNGATKGKIGSFTLLLGVMLSDVPHEFMGNLAVWPGTHHLYEEYFREHGPEALLDGMPPIDLPEPVQLQGHAGDIVLCHYQLAHTISQNASPHIRYAIYFRLHCIGHADQWKKAMTDIWLEWPGIKRD